MIATHACCHHSYLTGNPSDVRSLALSVQTILTSIEKQRTGGEEDEEEEEEEALTGEIYLKVMRRSRAALPRREAKDRCYLAFAAEDTETIQSQPL